MTNDPPATAATLPAPAPIRCANCGTPGSDRYCGHCGQRLDVHLHSVGHFVGEAAEVLTHSDSSLWSTLWPLLVRPGELTREFFAGRRARYLQPFRLYLVASVLLVAVNSLPGGHDFSRPAARQAPAAAPGHARAPVVAAAPTPAPAHVGAREADSADAAAGAAGNELELKAGDCSNVTSDARWMQRFIPTLAATCRSIVADNGRELGRALMHNAARAMFVFLPLLAGFMKLLYWRPRRYYLDHLLLLLHNHAFIYLLFATYGLARHWLYADWIESLLGLAVGIYCMRYLYKSMRLYYGQGRALTLAKYVVLGGAYCVAGLVTLMLTAFVTAVTL